MTTGEAKSITEESTKQVCQTEVTSCNVTSCNDQSQSQNEEREDVAESESSDIPPWVKQKYKDIMEKFKKNPNEFESTSTEHSEKCSLLKKISNCCRESYKCNIKECFPKKDRVVVQTGLSSKTSNGDMIAISGGGNMMGGTVGSSNTFQNNSKIQPLLNVPESFKKHTQFALEQIAESLSNIFTNTNVGSVVREVEIYAGFLLTCIFTLVAIISFAQEPKNKLGKVNLFALLEVIIGLIGMVFTIIDVGQHIWYHRCFNLKRCFKDGPHEEPEVSEPKCLQKCNLLSNSSPLFRHLITFTDILRLVVMEMMFYPGLLLSVFQLIAEIVTHQGKASEVGPLFWLQTIIGFLGDFLTVYLARVFVLGGTIYSLTIVRHGSINKGKICAAFFQIVFVFYSFGLMLIQIFMIVAIGSKFHAEFSNATGDFINSTSFTYTNVSANDISYSLSGRMWYMIIWSYYAPLFGIIMFFLVHHFWSQRFPISFLLDILKFCLSSRKLSEISDSVKESKPHVEKLINRFTTDIEQYDKSRFEVQVLFPFTSPVRVVICFIYFCMMVTFFSCYMAGHKTFDGWIGFDVFFIIFVLIVNIYAFSIVFLWILIFLTIIFAIVIFLSLCFFATCLSSSNSSNRRRY